MLCCMASRRSQSTMRIFLPLRANAAAILEQIVDFPSPIAVPDIITVLSGSSIRLKISAERSMRKDSANREDNFSVKSGENLVGFADILDVKD